MTKEDSIVVVAQTCTKFAAVFVDASKKYFIL